MQVVVPEASRSNFSVNDLVGLCPRVGTALRTLYAAWIREHNFAAVLP